MALSRNLEKFNHIFQILLDAQNTFYFEWSLKLTPQLACYV